MTQLRALIVDDEGPARRWLGKLLTTHPEIRVVGEADGVPAARAVLQELADGDRPDVVFLDIQMPPDTGFDLLPHLHADTQVIFITAFDNYAVKAFETHALDYLLKPVHPERLEDSIARLLLKFATSAERPSIVSGFRNGQGARSVEGLSGEGALQMEDILPLRDRDILRMVQVGRIAAILAEGAYTRLLICGQPPMMVLYSIGDWESRLPAAAFVRLDRSHIFNLTRVEEATMLNRNQTRVMLEDVASPLELGRAASQRLRQLLN